MKVVTVKTLAPNGLKMQEVKVEVAARPGLSSLTIVGLAGKSLVESKERIRLALRSIGVTLPSTAVVVNLAPAEIAKDGTHYDLPITLALLVSAGYLSDLPNDLLVFGELGLDGQIRRVRQAVSFAIWAKQEDFRCLFPKSISQEVSLVKGLRCVFGSNLADLLRQSKLGWHFQESHKVVKKELTSGSKRASNSRNFTDSESDIITFDSIMGQNLAKRAALIAVSGNHNLLLAGPPGVGKSLLAMSMKELLPKLREREQLEVTSVHSSAGLLTEQNPYVRIAPFRNPHHTSSTVALVGGGSPIKPGEVSLAHGGILYLDELPLFSKGVLEALREPLQNKQITISRSKSNVTYPADFLLVGAFNPCPCGFLGSNIECRCTQVQIQHYQAKLSGPIVDRFNLFARLSQVEQLEVGKVGGEHQSALVLVQSARQRQLKRQKKLNQSLNLRELEQIITEQALQAHLESLMQQLHLSLRSVMATVRVAQTIADLADSDRLSPEHLAEAIAFLPPVKIN